MSSSVVSKSSHVCEKLLLERSGNLYDCSEFADRHPGGRKVLQCFNGKDVTGIMRAKPHRHSKPALYLMESYKNSGSDRTLLSSTHTCSNDCIKRIKRRHEHSIDEANKNDYQIADLEHLVDWSQPMFWQVGKLGHQYIRWVHLPVDRELRLFRSDLAEFLSKSPWYAVPIFWVPLFVFLLWRGIYQVNLSYGIYLYNGGCASIFLEHYIDMMGLILLFFLGILSWTLLEYCLHRFLFHATPPANLPLLISLHFVLHGQHHKVPFDPGRLVFPPTGSSILILLLYIIITNSLPGTLSYIFSAGMLLGYICYDLIHYFLHHGVPDPGGYFDQLRRYHIQHHFAQPSRGFGISSKLWDLPFRTCVIDNYSDDESDDY